MAQQLTYKQITAKIKLVRASGEKFYNLVHETACSILLHTQEHRDARVMKALYDALPNSSYKAGFKFWVEKFSPIAWNDSTGVSKMRKPDEKKYNAFDIEAAEANPFWTLDEVKAQMNKRPFTMESLKSQLFGFVPAKKALIKAKLEAGEINQEEANAMLMFLGSVEIKATQPEASPDDDAGNDAGVVEAA